MIRINRSRIPIPHSLASDKGSGKSEANRNIQRFEAGKKEEMRFSAYSNKTVKEALIDLFHAKCAYCESKFLHVYPGDIEHFRPKGRIAEAPHLGHGYYWIAAEWDNLLLSCRNCNQNLSHKIFEETDSKTMGKMDQFPLSNGSYRAKSHRSHPNSIQKEEKYRLLIDPCKDEPKDHLEFDIKTAAILGKTNRGRTSIKVFVLQRLPLVQAREKLLIEIKSQLKRVTEATTNFNEAFSNNDSIKIKRYDLVLKRELRKLRNYLEPTEEFSAMAKQIILPYLSNNFGIK